ncbi:MAG: hypothetical protein DPW09_02070 [Anaerolineae bacterium]|nr:hypothetical protein [Anaerolineae bacterium]MCQ3972215.1 hypothetical protein [Anaerolineae bacterium]
MLKFLTVPQLAERCQAEAELYRQTKQSDETYCFELFHRALTERNEAAWQAVYAQYQTLVAAWVYGYSRFPDTNEEAAFFINGAFARMWQFGSKPETADNLKSLDGCLGYLKTCLWSAIEDYLRKSKSDALRWAVPLEEDERLILTVETEADLSLSLSELRQALGETIQTEVERLVAEESWVYGLPPRDIQAHHHDLFASIEAVSQVKKNLLKRLRRRLSRT